MQCTLNNVVCSVQCSVHCTVHCSVQCTVKYTLHCTLYTALYSVHTQVQVSDFILGMMTILTLYCPLPGRKRGKGGEGEGTLWTILSLIRSYGHDRKKCLNIAFKVRFTYIVLVPSFHLEQNLGLNKFTRKCFIVWEESYEFNKNIIETV